MPLCLLDLPVMARQVNTVLCSSMGSHSTTYCCLHDQSVHITGLVYSNICFGNLPSQPVHRFSITESGSFTAWRRWGPIPPDQAERGVPPFHQEVAWIQILAFSNERHRHRHDLHILWSLQRASVLAYTCNVLHHAVLHHHEEADQAYDQVQIPTLHTWEEDLQRQGRHRETFC